MLYSDLIRQVSLYTQLLKEHQQVNYSLHDCTAATCNLEHNGAVYAWTMHASSYAVVSYFINYTAHFVVYA